MKLSLNFADEEIIRSDDDYFSALISIRNELEPLGIRINCYGCSRNVYPSPLSIDMGAGEDARIRDLVSIFDSSPDVESVTVAEQAAFYKRWTKGDV